MIYKKDANFPYPILSNTSPNYIEGGFFLDVSLLDDTGHYYFMIGFEITSKFIQNLLDSKKAELVLIIQYKDNKFFNLNLETKQIKIPKARISLSKRTTLQLHIKSKLPINFSDNAELSVFYSQFKNDIVVPKNSLLGYSDTVSFDASEEKPFDLFEKKLDPQLDSDLKIELGKETIIIHFKDEKYQFQGERNGAALLNPYIYTGLRTALQEFITLYSDEDSESVTLADLIEPETPLHNKLFSLMKKKTIDELTSENIDKVIHSISDKLIQKYAHAVRELSSYGD